MEKKDNGISTGRCSACMRPDVMLRRCDLCGKCVCGSCRWSDDRTFCESCHSSGGEARLQEKETAAAAKKGKSRKMHK